ncbi:MAG TPA: FG-GAP-like repeat-containing protein [Mucilaginibacter sp.]|jgi:hypothetical protein
MKHILLTVLLTGIIIASFGQDIPWDVNGRGLSFIPDYTFKGSALTGWHTLGNNSWQASDREITVNTNNRSALLISNRSFQDIGLNLLVKVAPGAEAGIIFRLEKTSNGYKGILVSIKDDEAVSYRITLDGQGKELSREKLRGAGNIIRVAPPTLKTQDSQQPAIRRNGGNFNRPAGPTDLPMKRLSTAIAVGDWNQVEVFLDYNIIRKFINDDGDNSGGSIEDTDASYGPIALYAGGTGKVQFKDVKYKDIAVRFTPAEQSSSRFKVQRISDMYYSWSASAADFNHDGHTDIVAGPYIYYGPDYTHYQEVFFGGTYNASREFTNVNCEYAYDFNGDGWPDILTGPGAHPALYINPKGESRRWDRYEILLDDKQKSINIQSEITLFRDIDGDGKPELIYANNGALCYAKFDPADPTKPWKQYAISGRGYAMAHGIGIGDINGDGRMDIINPNGWWEQPKNLNTDTLWTYHPEVFARYGHRSWSVGGSVMAVYDVNGDGLNDVVTSLNAHGFGLAWFEQKRDKEGKISFIKHMIADDYSTTDKNAGGVTASELHGSTFADIDGDGIPDFIVGKRYWSHLDDYFDPDPYGPAVLYLYKTVRDKKASGGARFVPELVHNRSGAGSDVLAVDLNNDGNIDIVTSTDRGTFIFWNKKGGSQKGLKK